MIINLEERKSDSPFIDTVWRGQTDSAGYRVAPAGSCWVMLVEKRGGRETYQMFESYWPHVAKDPHASKGDRILADELNQMTKVVFSKTLKEVTWENSKLVKGNVIKKVKELKQGDGADIAIFGSGTIVQQLANVGLIDEYLLTVTPIILGTGKPLFKDVEKLNLELLETRDFKSGNALLHYRIVR